MDEKALPPGGLEVRQDPWRESPCSSCARSLCCRYLPLAHLRLESPADFINLALASCYDGLFPALKESGEWTVFLGRACRFLDGAAGTCSIHGSPRQNMVCKTYDARRCWYVRAFSDERRTTLIPFSTEMLLWFERRYGLMERRFDADIDRTELREAARAFDNAASEGETRDFATPGTPGLSFRKSRAERFLFFPPHGRPEHRNHFELLSFRLGFPGVSLAVADSHWAFLAEVPLRADRLESFRRAHFPTVGHHNGSFSFAGLARDRPPSSSAGDRWAVLGFDDLGILEGLASFDASGKVRRLPSAAEVLAALGNRRPDKAA